VPLKIRKQKAPPRKLGPGAATQAGYMILALIQLYRSSRPGLLTWVDREIRREIRRETNDLKIRWAVAKGFWDGEIWWMSNENHPFSWWNPSNRSILRDFSEVSELHHYCKLSIVSYVHDNIDTFIFSIRLRGLRAISFDGPWCQIWQISFVSASHLTGAAQHDHLKKTVAMAGHTDEYW